MNAFHDLLELSQKLSSIAREFRPNLNFKRLESPFKPLMLSTVLKQQHASENDESFVCFDILAQQREANNEFNQSSEDGEPLNTNVREGCLLMEAGNLQQEIIDLGDEAVDKTEDRVRDY